MPGLAPGMFVFAARTASYDRSRGTRRVSRISQVRLLSSPGATIPHFRPDCASQHKALTARETGPYFQTEWLVSRNWCAENARQETACNMQEWEMSQRKTMCAMKIFAAMVAISAMLASISYAQAPVGGPEPVPQSEDEKIEAAKQKAFEKDTDTAYKSTLKHLRDSNQKVDPWGGLRTPSAAGNK